MPYKVFADNDNYCVRKLNADGSEGETVPGGCHPTKAEADAHARAMWASEAKDITDATLTLLKEITEDEADSKPERAAAVLDERHDVADELGGRDDGRLDIGLLDLLDEAGVGHLDRVVDGVALPALVGDAVFHARRGGDQRKVELAFEALLNDLHVEEPEVAAAEAEAERVRVVRLIDERGVVQAQF